MKRERKAIREANRKAFAALMAEYNGQPVADHYNPESQPHTLNFRGCTLAVHFDAGEDDGLPSIFCRWLDPMDKIKAAKLPFHNQFSGKWNIHETTGAECVQVLADRLRSLRPSNYAHQQISAYVLEVDFMGGKTITHTPTGQSRYLQPGEDAAALSLTPSEAELAEFFA